MFYVTSILIIDADTESARLVVNSVAETDACSWRVLSAGLSLINLQCRMLCGRHTTASTSTLRNMQLKGFTVVEILAKNLSGTALRLTLASFDRII
jgi:hypothetical protein